MHIPQIFYQVRKHTGFEETKDNKTFYSLFGVWGTVRGERGVEIKHDYKNSKPLKPVMEIFSHTKRVSQGTGKHTVL